MMPKHSGVVSPVSGGTSYVKASGEPDVEMMHEQCMSQIGMKPLRILWRICALLEKDILNRICLLIKK